MRSSIERVLEIGVPVVLAYLVFGGSYRPSLLETVWSGSDEKLSSYPITRENVQWAIDTLALPTGALERNCAQHEYRPHIFSRDPLIVYLEDFLQKPEIDDLLQLSEPHFKASTIWAGTTESSDTAVRRSEKAPLSRNSSTTLCIEQRALSLQGWRPDVYVEKLWAQRYHPGDYYRHHYDWGAASKQGGRVSSFMVWLNDDFEGGGTNFPRVERHADEAWCKFHVCGNESGGELPGTTWKPRAGNAVYWENFKTDGSGYEESWHAGLPVTEGTKVGLNIWSWWQPGLLRAIEESASQEV